MILKMRSRSTEQLTAAAPGSAKLSAEQEEERLKLSAYDEGMTEEEQLIQSLQGMARTGNAPAAAGKGKAAAIDVGELDDMALTEAEILQVNPPKILCRHRCMISVGSVVCGW